MHKDLIAYMSYFSAEQRIAIEQRIAKERVIASQQAVLSAREEMAVAGRESRDKQSFTGKKRKLNASMKPDEDDLVEAEDQKILGRRQTRNSLSTTAADNLLNTRRGTRSTLKPGDHGPGKSREHTPSKYSLRISADCLSY